MHGRCYAKHDIVFDNPLADLDIIKAELVIEYDLEQQELVGTGYNMRWAVFWARTRLVRILDPHGGVQLAMDFPYSGEDIGRLLKLNLCRDILGKNRTWLAKLLKISADKDPVSRVSLYRRVDHTRQ